MKNAIKLKIRPAKYLIGLLLCMILATTAAGPVAAKTRIEGSGASFPYQIYSLWYMLFEREYDDLDINYIAKGSGSGIKDFIAHKVDFAASDAAMKDSEMAKVKEGVQLLPMTAGEIVLTYNLERVDNLKLPREVYPLIFLGKIKKWNDPRITAANPDVTLPDLDITVVTRLDSSGTTFVFTKHLSALSPEFKETVGTGKKPDWPEGLNMIKAPINAGLSAAIKKTAGSIGYIDLGFATVAGMKTASLENKAGNYIAPGIEGGQAALANADIPENMIVWLSDPAGRDSYPITTFTWMLFYKKYEDPEKAKLLREMVRFCVERGQKISHKVGYIPLPENVRAKVLAATENIQ